MSGEFVLGGGIPAEKKPEPEKTTVAKLLFGMTGLYERWRNEMESRGHLGGVRGPDPDYSSPITAEDLERVVKQIARDHEPGIHITNSGKSGPPAWQNKFLLMVGAAVTVSAITATATVIVTVASIRTRIDDYILSNDKRLDRDEHLIDDTQKRLDRGAGL